MHDEHSPCPRDPRDRVAPDLACRDSPHHPRSPAAARRVPRPARPLSRPQHRERCSNHSGAAGASRNRPRRRGEVLTIAAAGTPWRRTGCSSRPPDPASPTKSTNKERLMLNLALILIPSLGPDWRDTEEGFLGKLVLWAHQRIRYHRALRELSRLDDRDLDDINV